MMAYRACILHDGKLCMHDGMLQLDQKNAIDMMELLYTFNFTQFTLKPKGQCALGYPCQNADTKFVSLKESIPLTIGGTEH